MLPPSYLILLEISPIPFPFQADSVRINAERKFRIFQEREESL